MLAVSSTHRLPINRRITDRDILKLERPKWDGKAGDPSDHFSPALALMAHLAGIAVAATLILGVATVAMLGLRLVLP